MTTPSTRPEVRGVDAAHRAVRHHDLHEVASVQRRPPAHAYPLAEPLALHDLVAHGVVALVQRRLVRGHAGGSVHGVVVDFNHILEEVGPWSLQSLHAREEHGFDGADDALRGVHVGA